MAVAILVISCIILVFIILFTVLLFTGVFDSNKKKYNIPKYTMPPIATNCPCNSDELLKDHPSSCIYSCLNFNLSRANEN